MNTHTGTILDFSPMEAAIRKDVANLAQSLIVYAGMDADRSFEQAKRFYEIKDRYMKTGELPSESGAR